ncbi:TFIIA-alpha and beta-like factor [Rhinophrynus dorsalis]
MAHSANPNPVPKLYKSIIEDVIEGVSELFAEEGVDEQVLKELKQLWETKVMQSKATEGFFRDNNNAPQFVLQLPQNLHQSLHSSTVLPGGRNISNFAATDMNSSGSSSAFTLPAGLTYPIHLPAGMTVQTASGHLYKVTVPVMVTQAPGGPRILQQPMQQFFQHLSHASGPPTNNHYNGNTYTGQKWQQQAAPIQRSTDALNIYESETPINTNFQNNNEDSIIQQPADVQQLTDKVLNQPISGLEENSFNDLTPPLFSPSQTDLALLDNSESLLNNLNMTPDMQGQGTNECARLLKSQSPDVVDLLLLDAELNENIPVDDNARLNSLNERCTAIPEVKFFLQGMAHALLSFRDPTPPWDLNLVFGVLQSLWLLQMAFLLVSTIGKLVVPNDMEIIQVDGTGDTSSDEELGTVRDVDENEFLGIIDTEDLKALEEDDTASNDDSTSNSSDDEDPEIDVIEEDPLNSGDDVSEQEVPDLFDTDNVIVCQYDKIHRSKNKWKFYLKDGVMSFGGKDYVFSKAIGEAEW